MSTATATPTLDVSATQPIPFGRLVLVELRKSYDTRAGFWLLATIGIIIAIIESILMITVIVNDELISFEDLAGFPTIVAQLLLPVLGIILVTSEWGQRTAMVSFAIEPRRMRVVLAKLVVGFVMSVATVIVMFAIGLVCTTICEALQPDLTEWGIEWWLPLAFVFVMTLTMTVGFSMAALLINTPAAIVVFFLYWWGLTIALFVIADLISGFEDIAPWINFQAALEPVFEWSIDTAEEWGQLLVSAGLWIVLPLGLGLWRIVNAEVK
jgi:ABC-2 type transport system permease protein